MEVALRIHRLEHFGNGICRNVFQNFGSALLHICEKTPSKRYATSILLSYCKRGADPFVTVWGGSPSSRNLNALLCDSLVFQFLHALGRCTDENVTQNIRRYVDRFIQVASKINMCANCIAKSLRVCIIRRAHQTRNTRRAKMLKLYITSISYPSLCVSGD